jgi:ABC-type transport system involved in multi-copper enzyme maturation permease subunit
MQRVLAIAGLTWKAAFRFRLFIVVAVLLLAAVVGLPILIKDDGTARGFTQILLTYTLSVITGLLGFSTMWLSCGTLARDIEECQMQMVCVKPVARWQVWLGKWLGLVSLNAALLALSGLSVFLLLQWRATRLPEAEQKILRNEVLVARASARPPDISAQIEEETDKRLKQVLAERRLDKLDTKLMRQQIKEGLKAELQLVQPGTYIGWQVDLGRNAASRLRGQPLYLRIKFNTADQSPSGTFGALWQVGIPKKTKLWQSDSTPMSLAPDTFHEFQIPADLYDEDGILTIAFANPNNVPLLFPLEDGIEVLYREGAFGLNFVRGLGIILCWMALLAALGLAMASSLSFPVAAFASVAVLVMTFSSGTLATAVSDGTIMGFNSETGTSGHSPADVVVIPVFRAVLKVINLAKDFAPIDALSTGRSVTWGDLGRAVAQIVLLLGGVLALFGIWRFSNRELATAQGNA